MNSDIDIAIIVNGLSRDLKKQILNIVVELELKHLTPISRLIFSRKDLMTLEEEITLKSGDI